MEIKLTRMTNFGGIKYWAYDNPLDEDYNKHKIILNGFDLNKFCDDIESIWIDTDDYEISINEKNQLTLDLKQNKKFTFGIYK